MLSHCIKEASELAKKHGKLQLFGEILLDTLSVDELNPEDFNELAAHFEKEQNNLLAGKYYYHAREYKKVIHIFLLLLQRMFLIEQLFLQTK